MLPRIASGTLWCALLLALTAFQPAARAQTASPPKTRNVVLIVSDGLRWQEVFTGADPLLLNEKNGGIWDKEQELRREFWRADPGERRKALFPFLWTTVAAGGQIFGNQTKGSIARVTNGLAFSYPGYNEMLTGRPDPRINSNHFGPNPNPTVFEWLNGLPDLHGRVSVYATLGNVQGYLQRSTQQSSAAGWMGSALSRHAHCAAGAAQPALPEHDQVGRRGCLQRLPADPVARFLARAATACPVRRLRRDRQLGARGPLRPAASTARTSSITSSRSSGIPCRACRRIAIRLLSSSRPIMAAAADRSIGRSTASSSPARRTSGSRCSVLILHRSVSALTSHRSARPRLQPPWRRCWARTTAKRYPPPPSPSQRS